MTTLKNEFSWSSSRHKTFTECLRKYWYNYYGHWGGWERDADEQTRLIYILKNMTSLPAYLGTVVHEVIELACNEAKAASPTDRLLAYDRALAKLNKGYTDSKQCRWIDDPKRNVNLAEIYYGSNIPKERFTEIKTKLRNCLNAFFDSEHWRNIQRTPADGWLPIEQLDAFEVEGVRVMVKLDLPIRAGEKVVLYDWKTGKPYPADLEQLAVYAMYARHKGWVSSLKQIEVVLAYLAGNEWNAHRVTDKQINEQARRIGGSAAQMKERLADPANNTARQEDFPVTDDPRKCRFCQFRKVCEGAQRV